MTHPYCVILTAMVQEESNSGYKGNDNDTEVKVDNREWNTGRESDASKQCSNVWNGDDEGKDNEITSVILDHISNPKKSITTHII
jgi:hypothetical protein